MIALLNWKIIIFFVTYEINEINEINNVPIIENSIVKKGGQ